MFETDKDINDVVDEEIKKILAVKPPMSQKNVDLINHIINFTLISILIACFCLFGKFIMKDGIFSFFLAWYGLPYTIWAISMTMIATVYLFNYENHLLKFVGYGRSSINLSTYRGEEISIGVHNGDVTIFRGRNEDKKFLASVFHDDIPTLKRIIAISERQQVMKYKMAKK